MCRMRYISIHHRILKPLRIWEYENNHLRIGIHQSTETWNISLQISSGSLMSGPHGTNEFFSSNQQGHQFIFTLQGSPDQWMLPMEATSARVGCTSTHERRQYIQYEHMVCKPHILCLHLLPEPETSIDLNSKSLRVLFQLWPIKVILFGFTFSKKNTLATSCTLRPQPIRHQYISTCCLNGSIGRIVLGISQTWKLRFFGRWFLGAQSEVLHSWYVSDWRVWSFSAHVNHSIPLVDAYRTWFKGGLESMNMDHCNLLQHHVRLPLKQIL